MNIVGLAGPPLNINMKLRTWGNQLRYSWYMQAFDIVFVLLLCHILLLQLWWNWFSSHYSLLLLSNSIMRNHKIVLTIMLCTRIILLHSKSSICHEDRKYLGMPLIPSTLPLFLAKHLIYRFSCARNLLATSISSIIFIHDVLREIDHIFHNTNLTWLQTIKYYKGSLLKKIQSL